MKRFVLAVFVLTIVAVGAAGPAMGSTHHLTLAAVPPAHGCDQATAPDDPNNQYHSTCDGTASQNGNGNGAATGKPCAGCVGAADNKNPPGQFPNGSDANNGYECDGNNGVGKTNPAHTGCQEPYSGAAVPTANQKAAKKTAAFELRNRPVNNGGEMLALGLLFGIAALSASTLLRKRLHRN